MSAGEINSLNLESRPSILDATKLMLKKRTGSIVIVNRKMKAVGIVTERDILRKASSTRRKLSDIEVKEIMSSPVATVKPYDSVDTAAEAMARKKIKRLVVVEQDGSLVGIISITDITRKLASILAAEHDRYGKLKTLLEN